MFPNRPYHKLLKDDKLQTDDFNNPVNDSKKSAELFIDEVNAFNQLDISLKRIYFLLLRDQKEFKDFFDYMSFECNQESSIVHLINQEFKYQFCSNNELEKFVGNSPIALAYCLALMTCSDHHSITPPWVLMNYPEVERLVFLLRNNPCLTGCAYCRKSLNAKLALKQFFGFKDYRTFDGQPLQENAVNAAIMDKSLLAVFPTGVVNH